MSQSVLAGLVGRSESWLSQVERGKRSVDSHAVLTRLASILGVDIAEITDCGDAADTSTSYPHAARIEQAMMDYHAHCASITAEETRRVPSVTHLREMAGMAYQRYQATRYEAAGWLLPELIRGVEAASRTQGPIPAICEVRALIYDTTAALLNRIGEPILAWTAADRAMAAAEASGEPLLAAVGAYRLSYVFTARNHPREAHHGLARAYRITDNVDEAHTATSTKLSTFTPN
jgi:transcriptional regulator with XRE-family HTH domain